MPKQEETRENESKLAELTKTVDFALKISEIYHKNDFPGKGLPINGDKNITREGFAEHLYHILEHVNSLPKGYPEKTKKLYEGLPLKHKTEVDSEYNL